MSVDKDPKRFHSNLEWLSDLDLYLKKKIIKIEFESEKLFKLQKKWNKIYFNLNLTQILSLNSKKTCVALIFKKFKKKKSF